MYGDFILKIDWRVKRRSDNSGVFIRFSDPGADPWNAVKTGYEIQIDDLALPDGRTEHKTGAIYDIVPPATLASKHVGDGILLRSTPWARTIPLYLIKLPSIPFHIQNTLFTHALCYFNSNYGWAVFYQLVYTHSCYKQVKQHNSG
jgi:hypothetical protein